MNCQDRPHHPQKSHLYWVSIKYQYLVLISNKEGGRTEPQEGTEKNREWLYICGFWAIIWKLMAMSKHVTLSPCERGLKRQQLSSFGPDLISGMLCKPEQSRQPLRKHLSPYTQSHCFHVYVLLWCWGIILYASSHKLYLQLGKILRCFQGLWSKHHQKQDE